MAFENGEVEIYEIFGFICKRLFILGENKKIQFFQIYEGYFLYNLYWKLLGILENVALGEVFLVLKDGQLVSMRKSEASSNLSTINKVL